MDDTLREEPFNLGDLETIYTRVIAFNVIGDSLTSPIGSLNMPIAPIAPDPPINFVRNEESTTKTQVAFSWSAPASDGGSPIIDYSVFMDDDDDDFYEEV